MMGCNSVVFVTKSPDETVNIGRMVGERLVAGSVVTLWGEMGAGKTTITRGIAYGLGIPRQIPITSPTFTMINEYDGRLKLYHIDLYRISSVDELDTLPLREIIHGEDGVVVIEWPEKLEIYLPESRLDIMLDFVSDNERLITLKGVVPDGLFEETHY